VCTVSRSCNPAILQRTGADVSAGVEFAHDTFEDSGAQLRSAQTSEAGSQVGVEAGEGVVAGSGQVGVRAGELVGDGLGEGIPGGLSFLGGLFVADGVAQQLAELIGGRPRVFRTAV
jgi:hypothetical protein